VLDGFNPLDPARLDDPGPLTAIARRQAPVFVSPSAGWRFRRPMAHVEIDCVHIRRRTNERGESCHPLTATAY
jgi:hypothetical protein